MSITDELREWAKTLTHWWYDPVKDEYTYTTGIMPPSIDAIRLDSIITAIADRIDAEHEAMLVDARKTAYQGYIELPKDADGEPIHVGDVMEFSAFEVEKPVTRTVDGIGQGVFFAWCGERGYQQHEAKRYCHYHAPTVEDVLTEFGIDAEHESACAEAYGNGVMSVPIALDESAWVELPKDADGVPWHIGDRTESGQTIQAMGLNKHGWHFVGTVNDIDPSIHRHYHAPTVEDVLREFALKAAGRECMTMRSDLVDEYASKLQLREDA